MPSWLFWIHKILTFWPFWPKLLRPEVKMLKIGQRNIDLGLGLYLTRAWQFTCLFLPKAVQISSAPVTVGSSIKATRKLCTSLDTKSGMITVTLSPTGMLATSLLMKGLTTARMTLWEETSPSWHRRVTLLSLWQLFRRASIYIWIFFCFNPID